MGQESGSFVAEHLTLYNLVATTTIYIAVSAVIGLLRAPKYPGSIPWVGHGKSWIASVKNAFDFSNRRHWFQIGYEKYHKEGRAFVIPSAVGMPTEVSLPRSQMQWMIDQPDNVLSTSEAHFDILNGSYAFVKPAILKDPYHEHVIHKNLARNLNAIIPELADEVKTDVEEVCGDDTQQFKKFDLMDEFLLNIIPKITNRMLVGQTIGRNPDYLKHMMGFTMDVVYSFILFPLLPHAIRPIIGSLYSIFPKYHWWRTRKHTLPLIKKRLEDWKRKETGDPEYAKWTAPNDFITWTIRTASQEGRTDELHPERISMRICPLNFASIHTTAMTAQYALIDILSSDPSVVEALRDEATRIYNEEGQQWTKAGLARMYKLDSAIRESQRHSTMALSLITKKVVAKEGVTSPEGVHYPLGCVLSTAWLPVAHDDEVHKNSDVYDPFRFSREREHFDSMSESEKAGVDILKLRQSGMVTTGHSNQAFGHGRHACPGRFFVAHELKIMFAHLFMHYEIEHLKEKPVQQWVGQTLIPPKVDISVRRRKSS